MELCTVLLLDLLRKPVTYEKRVTVPQLMLKIDELSVDYLLQCIENNDELRADRLLLDNLMNQALGLHKKYKSTYIFTYGMQNRAENLLLDI